MGFIRWVLSRLKARRRNGRASQLLTGLNPELMRRAVHAADAVEMPLDAWIVFALASELVTEKERREGDGGVDAAFRLAGIERRGARLFFENEPITTETTMTFNPQLMRRAIHAADDMEMPLEAWIVLVWAGQLVTDEERDRDGMNAVFELAGLERGDGET